MIVGICGLIGSGKDTIADYLISNYGFKRMSFATTLKDSVAAVFGWDRIMLEGLTKEARAEREQVDKWWAERLNIPHLSPRWVLQYWGTEVCRQHFHQDIWIASLENRLRKTDGHVVISDCRFPNEIDSIKRLGGTTVRVYRGEKPDWYPIARARNKLMIAGTPEWVEATKLLEDGKVHASEYSSVGLKYDYYLDNNHSLADLYAQVRSVVNL